MCNATGKGDNNMACHQISFTRVSGQGGSYGWQAVNISPDLPTEVVAAFSRFQNANINPPKFDIEDEQEQFVLDMQIEDNSVFFTGLKYNIGADDRGRSNMFANAFVFSLSDFVLHPNTVLNVQDNNFHFSIEETTNAPDTLTRYEARSLEDHAEAIGLTKDRYTVLMQCVYQLLSAKTKNSLHIICSVSPETIRSFMICIYMALPFEFRKKVSFSTYELPNGLPRTIVFERQKHDDGSYYFDAGNGENNVLSDAALRKLSRYDFISVVPQNLAADQANEDYFLALEKKLEQFDSAHATSLELYKIAADLLADEQNSTFSPSPEQLCMRLNELLSAPVNHPYLDQQIQYVLGDIIEYRITLNDVLSEKLCRKLETTKNQDLIDCGYLYNSERINRMGIEDGAKYLSEAFTDRSSESFVQIKALLDHDPKGQAILNHLYTRIIASSLQIDRESIVSFYAETRSLSDRRKIQECIYQLVGQYSYTLVKSEMDAALLAEKFSALIHEVLEDRPDMQDALLKHVKQEYWKAFSFTNLDLEAGKKYEQLAVLENQKCQIVFAAIQLLNVFKADDARQFFAISSRYFGQEPTVLSRNDRSVVVKKILDACVDNQYQVNDYALDTWICASYLLVRENDNPVRFLLKNHVRPLYRNFEYTYPRSAVLQREGFRSRFVQWLTECAQEKEEYSRTALEILRIIRESEKRMLQEQKRQQREEQKDVKESSGRNAFMSGITGLFRRKSEDKKDDWS